MLKNKILYHILPIDLDCYIFDYWNFDEDYDHFSGYGIWEKNENFKQYLPIYSIDTRLFGFILRKGGRHGVNMRTVPWITLDSHFILNAKPENE